MKKQIPLLTSCSITDDEHESIVVMPFGPYLRMHNQMVFPHRHGFYHFVLFTKGSGGFSIDFNRFTLHPRTIYFMTPGQVHSWDFESETDGYVVNFNMDFFQSFLLRPDYLERFPFFSGNAEDGVLIIPESIWNESTQIFENILGLEKSADKDPIRVRLLGFFLMLEKHISGKKQRNIPSYNYTILRNFQKLIERHFASKRLPKSYAEMLYVTPNHLNALCKDYFGIPAGEVIRNRILLEAKRSLINQELTISEIAYALNFNDNSYFTKFFKKNVGLTPEEFRNKTLKTP